ncbi:hypothetical protein HK405_006674, partial [Cladochytrium tenue]
QLRNLAENACKGYLDTAEMWVLAYERADSALRRLQNAAASAPSSSSAFAAPKSGAPGVVDDNKDEHGDPCFALAAAVLAQACEIELVSDSVSAHPRHLLRRFRLWVCLDHGHAHAIPAAADYTAAPLTLELREDLVNGIIIRNWVIFVTSTAADVVPCDAAAAATLCALVKKTIGPADAEQSAHASVESWTPALATAAVQALLVWPLPGTTSATLPVSPALHAAVMRHSRLRDALRAFAVGAETQSSSAPPQGVARLELSRFWTAAVVSVIEETLDL